MKASTGRIILAPILRLSANWPWIPYALLVVIACCDYLTGADIKFAGVYILPVVLVAWWRGPRAVLIISVIATLSWIATDIVCRGPYSSSISYPANFALRFGVYSIIGLLVAQNRSLHIRQRDLANYIVHDLRSPLTTFLNIGELFAEELEVTPTKDLQELIDLCHSQAKSMETLINAILDLYRLEEGKIPVNIQKVDVSQAVNAAIVETSTFAHSKNVSVSHEFNGVSGTVHADPVLLGRMLVNLLTNAIKVSPDRTRVIVRTLASGCDSIVFSVVDSGTGVPSATVASLFDRFFQDELAKRTGTGFGLGLAFCHHAAIAQHGKIWVQNIFGDGASFSVELPTTDK